MSVSKGQRRRNRIKKYEEMVLQQERIEMPFQDVSIIAIYELFTNRYNLKMFRILLDNNSQDAMKQ